MRLFLFGRILGRVSQIALVLLVALEIGFVPAAALEPEHGGRHQPGQLRLTAMRAFLEQRIADFLHGLQCVAATLALILVKRHGIPLQGTKPRSITNLNALLGALDSVQAFLFEHQRVALELGDHAVARDEVAFENALRQRILDLRLDGTLQRPGAVPRIEARLADLVARIIVEPKRYIALRQALSQASQLNIDNGSNLFP